MKTKIIEANGSQFNCRLWTVADWRQLQADCKDKDLIEQWLATVRFSLDPCPDTDALTLAELDTLNAQITETNLPFLARLQDKSSSKIPN